MDKIHTNSFEMSAISIMDEYITGILNGKYEDDRIFSPLTNLLIRFVISKYMILTMKEDVITKPKNSTYNNTLLFSNIEKIALAVTDKNLDGTYDMNGKIFIDPNTVVAYVRNKLAHGDYELSDDYRYIIFAPEGERVPVEVLRIEYLGETIASAFGEYRSSNKYSRGMVLTPGYKPINKVLKPLSDVDLNTLLNESKILKFELTSKDEVISKKDFEIFDSIIENIKTKPTKSTINDVIEYYKNFIRDLSNKELFNSRLDMTFVEIPYEEKEYIKMVFRKLKGYDINYFDSLKELTSLILRTSLSKYNNFYTNLETVKLLKIFRYAYNTKTSDIRRIINDLSIVNEKVICNGIFNIEYDHIALTQILKLMTISCLFENNDVQYDLITLLGKYPKTFIIKDTREDELIQKIYSASDRISENKKNITSKRVQISNIEASTMEQEKKDKIIKELHDFIKEVEKTKKNNITEMKKNKKELDKLQNSKKDNKDYYYNKYLIEYIRNSICHGNVDIIPAGTIDETIIRFRDYDKDELVFEYELTVLDIKKIISANVLKLEVIGIVNSVNKKHL